MLIEVLLPPPLPVWPWVGAVRMLGQVEEFCKHVTFEAYSKVCPVDPFIATGPFCQYGPSSGTPSPRALPPASLPAAAQLLLPAAQTGSALLEF